MSSVAGTALDRLDAAVVAGEAKDLLYFERYPHRRRRIRWMGAMELNGLMRRSERAWWFTTWDYEPWPRYPEGTRARSIVTLDPEAGRIRRCAYVFAQGTWYEADSSEQYLRLPVRRTQLRQVR